MKRKNFKTKKLACALTLGLMATAVSCTDSSFDFSNIDVTIGIGGDSIAFPASSTQDIMLDDVLDLDNSDLISIEDNGDYVFSKDGGDVRAANPSVDVVRISKRQITTSDLVVNVNGSTQQAAQRGTSRAAAVHSVEGVVSKFSYQSDANNEIVDLKSAEVESAMSIDVTFSQELRRVLGSFKTISLIMPQYATFELESSSVAPASFDGHTMTFNNLSTSGDLHIRARLVKLDFGTAQSATNQLLFDKNSKKAVMNGNVVVKAQFDDILSVSADPSKCFIHTEMQLGDITVNKATGMFDPKIDLANLGDVTINSIPDFLTDKDVSINLHNPMIDLAISNNIDIEAVVKGEITAYDNNGQKLASVTVPDITVKAGTDTRVRLCKTDDGTAPDGTEVKVVPTLATLMTKIPHRLCFTAEAHANAGRVSTIQLGKRDYQIKPSYCIKAPLAFDEGAQIVYRDTLDGWHDDIDDLSLAEGAYLKVTANVENRVPANLSVSAYAIDTEGREVSAQRVEVKVVGTVKGSEDGTSPVVSPLDVRLYERESGALKSIDGLVLRVVAAAGEGNDAIVGKTINAKTQTLVVRDIKIKLYGRVIGDFN